MRIKEKKMETTGIIGIILSYSIGVTNYWAGVNEPKLSYYNEESPVSYDIPISW